MRKLLLLAGLLLAGCGGGGDSGNEAAPTPANGAAPAEERRGAAGKAVDTAGLTGLYEGGDGPRKSQLCVVDKGAGDASFGIAVWGANDHSCMGAGSAVRDGGRLTLTMAGDSACRIDARIENGRVTLPADVGAGCAYYCGARASFGNASFTRTGTTAQDAMKATDIVGEPLCEG
jgi:hypothetical protein